MFKIDSEILNMIFEHNYRDNICKNKIFRFQKYFTYKVINAIIKDGKRRTG